MTTLLLMLPHQPAGLLQDRATPAKRIITQRKTVEATQKSQARTSLASMRPFWEQTWNQAIVTYFEGPLND